jgi:hypothetical protein
MTKRIPTLQLLALITSALFALGISAADSPAVSAPILNETMRYEGDPDWFVTP